LRPPSALPSWYLATSAAPILATGPDNAGPSNLGLFEDNQASSLYRDYCP
jgi:hypothetical protein